MHINTHSRDTMENSICNCFNISINDLTEILDMAGIAANTELYFDGDIFNKVIDTFIYSKAPKVKIEQISFFHLSRRLNSNDCYVGNNLFDMLSTENVMTDFLKKHNIVFIPTNGRLDLIYKGILISLNDTGKDHVPYLRSRFGYNKGRIDYCFNGFALKDLICKTNYARELYRGPEFIQVLAAFLKNTDITTDFLENSKYFCFEYCIPIDIVLFDDNDKFSKSAKQRHLLDAVFDRLYAHRVRDTMFVSDHTNPILRLVDNDTMKEEHFISKEEITLEMLR